MTTPRPSLLQAAKAFVAKSTKVAAVIAPLAMAAVPTEAEAQIVFGPIDSASGEIIPPSGGGSPSNFTVSNWFTQSLSPQDGFAGQQFGVTHTITGLQGYDFTAVIRLYSNSGGSGTLAVDDELVPFAYRFSLSASAGITNASWMINVNLTGELDGNDYTTGFDADPSPASFDSGTEIFFGDTDLFTSPQFGVGETSPEFDLEGYYLEFTVFFSASSPDDWITLGMDSSAGDGFALGSNTLTSIPEPSTYALLVGFASVGYAAFRRRRAA
jgi:hypothetical protein